MKKIVIFFALVSFVYLGWWQIQKERKLHRKYLKEETNLRYLQKELFLQKLRSPLPLWMQEQMEEDFHPFASEGISKESLDETFANILQRVPSPMIVRYRIINNRLYRYFPKGERISLEDNSTERALKTILHCVKLPDMDFIFSFFDGITLEDHYLSEPEHAPVFFSAKVVGVPRVILVPDWRSIGFWWISDIEAIRSRVEKFPWEKKKEFAVWRGSLTKWSRRKLCELSKLYPSYLDAKFNFEVNPETKKGLEEEGLFGDRITWEAFLECKYLPLMDGVVCAAPAFQWRLLSQSVTFKPDSNEVQWFYRDLKPYIHYIPVQADLSDLIEKFEWAKAHDAECKIIAQKAAQFAQEFLMYEDVLLYFTKVLMRYATLQKTCKGAIAKEVEANAQWVCIHHRKKLKQKAEQKNREGYCLHPTPF